MEFISFIDSEKFADFMKDLSETEGNQANLDRINSDYANEIKTYFKDYKIEINSENRFTLSKNGEKPIDIKKVQEKLGGEFNSKGVYVFDFEGILKEMGVPEEEIKNNRSKIEEIEKKYNDSELYRQLTREKELETNARNLEQKIGEIKNAQEFQTRLYDKLSKESKAKIDELQKKLDDAKSGKTRETVGKWLKRAAIAYAGLSVYAAAEKHRKLISGCWLINTRANDLSSKCKVYRLTCPDAQKFSDDNAFKVCGECHSDKCSGGTFDPCLINDKSTNLSVTNSPSNPITKNICNICSCQGDCTEQNDPPCKNCNADNFNISPGYTLYCKNASLFEALNDLLNSGLDEGENILKKVLKILEYIALGIIILIVIYFLIRLIIYLINKGKEKGNRKSNKKK